MNNVLQTSPRKPIGDEERVRDFQRKLYQKAKQEAEFRFYVLYDKVRMGHFLREAYRRCRQKGGAPGVDRITFEDIEKNGIGNLLAEIQQELADRTYRPSAVKRVYIPKANGKMRPLGIPTIKDRIVQMSCKMVIEPIFEADFTDDSFGFRPKRSAQDAVTRIKELLADGSDEILDADLSAYFDTIPHDKLIMLVARRISDRNVIHLIKLWLKAPISENGTISGGKENKIGTPQGGVISPLLANIYMDLIDKAVRRVGGVFQREGIRIVRYADDFVLLGKEITEAAVSRLKGLLERMGLKLNEEKTRLVRIHAEGESFQFLGFEFRYNRDKCGRDSKYLHIGPSPKSAKKVREKISETLKFNGHTSPRVLVQLLNGTLRGWCNYFTIPTVSYPQKTKRSLRWYLSAKLTRYYQRKSQRACTWAKDGAMEKLTSFYGLIDPAKYAPTVNA